MCSWAQSAHCATCPPSAAVRQRSIALITLSWVRLMCPAFSARQTAPWARKISATSNDGNGMVAYEDLGLFFFPLLPFRSSNGLSTAAVIPVATLA